MNKGLMAKGLMASWLWFVALSMIFNWTGCSTTKSIYGKVPFIGPRSDLKKRVLLMPIVNQSGLDEDRVEEMNADLIQHLTRHPAADMGFEACRLADEACRRRHAGRSRSR